MISMVSCSMSKGRNRNAKHHSTHFCCLLLLILLTCLNSQATHAQTHNDINIQYYDDINESSNNNNNNKNIYDVPKNTKQFPSAKTEAKTAPKRDQSQATKPNIVIILIDDLGFNDFSFHGSDQIITPNIDALAYNGIILNKHYVPNLCTPSRATLLTGKNPIHTGTQHFVIVNDEPWGLPLDEVLMPEIFRANGYSTNLVGKWHLGFYKKEMTPTMRGFDYHYGYYSGYIDYWDYTMRMLNRNYSFGLDMRRNLQPWRGANGTYATDEFTNEAVRVIAQHDERKPLFLLFSHLAVHTGNEDDPMQAHQAEVDKFPHISDKQRRTYAGMISSLDRSVGKTVAALAAKGMLDNSIILLYSDNGAPTVGIHANGGSNFPFRGQKESPWEGGLRSAGLIWSPLLRRQNYVSNQLIHAADWFPTLAKAADIELPAHLRLDGLDMWRALSERAPPKERSLLHVLDDRSGYLAYMRDGYKLINGSSFGGAYDTWYGELAHSLDEPDPSAGSYVQSVLSSQVHEIIGDPKSPLDASSVEKLRAQATWRCPKLTHGADPTAETYRCEPLKAPCLFNIVEDPCERFNLAQFQPGILASLQEDIEAFRKTAVPVARVEYSDPFSDPVYHNGTWQWWSHLSSSAASSPVNVDNGVSTVWLGVCSGLMWLRSCGAVA